jgi:hypothetical protein
VIARIQLTIAPFLSPPHAGSNDEAASLAERSERLLYYYPHETPVSEQLRRVGYYEGLVDFSRTFSPSAPVQSLTLHKRRILFLEAEPQVWVVLAVVREQVAVVQGYQRSTDAPDTVPLAGAAGAGGGGGLFGGGAYAGPPGSAAPTGKETAFTSDSVADSTLRGIMAQIWEGFRLFYGPVTRALGTPAAAGAVAHLADVRTRLRKAQVRRETAAYNAVYNRQQQQEAAAAAAAGAAMATSRSPVALSGGRLDDVLEGDADGDADGDAGAGRPPLDADADAAATGTPFSSASSSPSSSSSSSPQPSAAETQAVDALAAEEFLVACQIRLLERFSPVTAVRRLLRDWVDFSVYYVDWCNPSPLGGAGYVRGMPMKGSAWQFLSTFAGKLGKGIPSLRHLSVLYDGYVVWGGQQPGIHALYNYLRAHAFHAVRSAQQQQALAGVGSSSSSSVSGGDGGGGGAAVDPAALRTVLYEPDRRDYDFSTEEVNPGAVGGGGAAQGASSNPPMRLSLGATMGGGGGAQGGGGGAASAGSPLTTPDKLDQLAMSAAPGPLHTLRRNTSTSSSILGGGSSNTNLLGLGLAAAARDRSGSLRQLSAAGGAVAGAGVGVVSFVDGRAWSEPVDVGAAVVELADMLAAQPRHLASLLLAAASTDSPTRRPPLLENALRQAAVSAQAVPASPISPAGWQRGGGGGGGGGGAGVGASYALAELSYRGRLDTGLSGPDTPTSPDGGVGAGLGRAGAGGASSQQPAAARAAAQSMPTARGERAKAGLGGGLGLSATLPSVASSAAVSAAAAAAAAAARSAVPRLPIHSPANKPAPLPVPALPGAADAQRCLRTVVAVDEAWPVLGLPYISPAYFATLPLLVEASGGGGGGAGKDGEAPQIPSQPVVSSGCLGPPWPPLPRAGGGGSGAATPGSSTPQAGGGGGGGGIAAPAPVPLLKKTWSMFRFGGGGGDAAAAAAVETVASSSSAFAATPSALSSAGGDEPSSRIFMPALFTEDGGGGGGGGAATGPSCRLLWVQQGLVTVLAGVEPSALLGKGPGGGGDGAGSLSSSSPLAGAAPADVDARSAVNLARTLTSVCEVFVPPLEEALGDAFDARATRAGDRGLEGVKTFGVDARAGTLDVHGTRLGARRPGRARGAGGALLSQAGVVSSAEANGDLAYALRGPLSALHEAVGEGGAVVSASSTQQLARHVVMAAVDVDVGGGEEGGEGEGAGEGKGAGAAAVEDGPAGVAAAAAATTAAGLAADGPSALLLLPGGRGGGRGGARSALWPSKETHLLATRTAGVASATRSGPRSTLVVFDDFAADKRRLDGHIEGDLREAVARAGVAEGLMFGKG